MQSRVNINGGIGMEYKRVLSEEEKRIRRLAEKPAKRLDYMLCLIVLQLEIAYANKNTQALERLRDWEIDVTSAISLKHFGLV